MNSSATLVENLIQRPDEPRHFMVIEPLEHTVEAWKSEQQIACSTQAIRLKEVGYRIYDPVIYFPQEDVDDRSLVKSEKTTACPLKGSTEYCDLLVCDQVFKSAAWSYCDVYGFDERIEQLKGRIAFDTFCVQIIEFTTDLP